MKDWRISVTPRGVISTHVFMDIFSLNYHSSKDMASSPLLRFTKGYVALILISFCLSLPILVVLVYPTDSPQPYVFEARITEKLGESLEGKLRFYKVERIQGDTPDELLVVTIDDPYTRGGQSPEYLGSYIWMMGDNMTREVYYEEQYLFFDLPQLYISQVRTGWLWPDQVTGLTILYSSPATTLFAPISLLMSLSGETTALNLSVLGFKSVLIAVTAYLTDRCRKKEGYRTIIILVYCILSIVSTAIILGELY